MKLTRKFITDIHGTVRKFPDQKAFLKCLYPAAFEEAYITTLIDLVVDQFDCREAGINIVYLGKEIGNIRLFQKDGYFFRSSEPVSKEHLDKRDQVQAFAKWQLDPGYSAELSGTGFQIIRYGPEPENIKEAK